MKPVFQIILKFLIITTLSGFVSYYLYGLNNKGELHKKTTQKYDIINFGNSHGNSFFYKTYGIKGKNLYINGNSPYYYLQLYKYYKENLNSNAIIIIPLSYFSFGIDAGANNGAFNNQFYHFLKPSLIRDYKLQKHLDIVNSNISSNVFDLIENNKFNEQKTDTTSIFRPHSYAKFSYAAPMVLEDKSIDGKKVALKQQKVFNDQYINANVNYLSLLIEDALKSNFRPILVTPPYLKDYYKNYQLEWLKDNFYKNVDNLEDNFKIPYFDFSRRDDYKNSVGMFRDAHHVNNFGRIKFTKIILQELISLNYLDKKALPIEVKLLSDLKIEKDLILERVEILDMKGTEKKVLFLFFNKSLKEYFNNRKIKFKFLNGKTPVYKDLNQTENFIFLKLNKLNKNSSFSFEEDKLKITSNFFVN